jgi:hypothetical protein
MAYGGEVDTDLMGSPRLRIDLKGSETIKLLNPLPSGDRHSSFFRPGGHSLPLTRMSSDRRIDQTFLLAKLTIRDGQVDFFNRSIPKLLGQLMISLIVFGNDHHAGGIFI